MPHLLVVGASLAGLRAAEAARAAGHDGPVTLVGAEPHLPYDRPPLSKQLLAPGGPPTAAPLRTREELEDLGVGLRLGAPATALDTVARRVEVGGDSVAYDALVVATGATPRLPPLPHLRGVRTLRTAEDAYALREALDARQRVVVLGAGFVGLEVATAALDRGLPVTVVEASGQPLARAVGPRAADLLLALVRDAGVDLRLGTTAERLEGRDGALRAVHLSGGARLEADLLTVGIGTRATTDWLRGSDVTVDDGVVCDASLRTSAEGVWAAGDVARVAPATGATGATGAAGGHRTEHWTAAHDQGALAGRNAAAWLAGEPQGALAGTAYVWSDLLGSKVQLLGDASGADRTEQVGDAGGPWLVLYGRDGRFAGVLGRDLPGRVMKFRRLLLAGASLDEAVDLALSKPLPAVTPVG